MSSLDWPIIDQYEGVTVLEDIVHSNTVYLNVLFPNKYRYYFEFVRDDQNSILIENPFRLYFPQTILVEWAPPDGTNGIYITLGSNPAFMPFGPLTVQIYIPPAIYNAMITAFQNPIGSPADLVPPPSANTSGVVEFVLLSTDAGEQIKVDLVNSSYAPEIPVTVKTLQWNEVLYYIMNLEPPPLIPLPPLPPRPVFSSLNTFCWGLRAFGAAPWGGSTSGSEVIPSPPPPSPPFLPPSPPLVMDLPGFEFAYTESGDLGITFIDPRYCFLREWITFPAEWTNAIKDFAGIQ